MFGSDTQVGSVVFDRVVGSLGASITSGDYGRSWVTRTQLAADSVWSEFDTAHKVSGETGPQEVMEMWAI